MAHNYILSTIEMRKVIMFIKWKSSNCHFKISGPELEEQKLLILRKEIQVHVTSAYFDQIKLQHDFSKETEERGQLEADQLHEGDQIKLQRCLRSQLKSSAEAAIILDQSRYLQGIPFTQRELKAERGKIWSKLFFASLLLFLLFQFIGIITFW